MHLDNEQESRNVEDRRGRRTTIPTMGGTIGRISKILAFLPFLKPLLKSKIGWVVLGAALLFYLKMGGGAPSGTATTGGDLKDKEAVFISKVLKTTEDVWHKLLPKYGYQYREPKLVLYRGSTRSGCGFADAQMGPFYCPVDEKIYLDLTFFDELERRFGAKGDFAQAYVLAHEVGHHVQNIMGILSKIRRLQEIALRRGDQVQANHLQIPVELQADCLAGVWAHYVQDKLDPGDIEEGIRAAAAVGDDMIQKRTQGYVIPDSFTHGTAKQRVSWFVRGYKSGDLRSCNTFQ
ncbi:MAG: zinc metallopeptidase [Epsilonproteobacteria bacterium]|nr:hypothetical protein [Campylobacterota bacterium]NPA56292.1 zinc metallopeptidase [Campylobacterota bacterium]